MTKLNQFNYISKGFDTFTTLVGDQFIKLDGENGKNTSYSTQNPKFKKNNYGYLEIQIDTEKLKIQGSTSSYEKMEAKFSSFFLFVSTAN